MGLIRGMSSGFRVGDYKLAEPTLEGFWLFTNLTMDYEQSSLRGVKFRV